jgi:hypothetical protein
MNLNALVLIIIVLSALFIIGSFLGLLLLFYFKTRKASVITSNGESTQSTEVTQTTDIQVGVDKQQQISPNNVDSGVARFGIKEVSVPLIILLISIVISLVFWPQLPPELAFRFGPSGIPVSYADSLIVAVLCLGFQAFIITGGWLIGFTIIRIAGSLFVMNRANIRTRRIALLVANMVILPQIIVAFIMADIFSFNVSGIHLMPLWTFTIIVMVIGAVAITFVLLRTLRRKY